LEYLTDKRKISVDVIKKFNLGFAPNRDNTLSQYLVRKKGHKEEDVVNAGLAYYRNGRLFDFFKNRVIFPICDVRNNIVAFSGRLFDETSITEGSPKYVNTRETLVYKKRDTLFGLNIARDEIRKENRVIIVEGEFDVISSFKEGIKNIVAVKGTALTESQIKNLKRFAEKLTFCFDSDQAGIDAQIRSIELIEKEGVTATVIVPPSGKDPDELIKENPALFKKAVKEDINAFDFIINQSLAEFDKNDSYGKKKILEKVLPFLTLIENEVIKEHYFKKLARSIDASIESLSKQADKIKNKIKPTPTVFSKQTLSREEITEQYLLSLILQSKDSKKSFLLVTGIIDIDLTTPIFDRLYKKIDDYLNLHDSFIIGDFIKTLPTEFLEAFDKCYLAPIPTFEDEKKYLFEIEKISNEVKTLALKNKLKDVTQRMKEKQNEGKDDELEKLNEEFSQITTSLKGEGN